MSQKGENTAEFWDAFYAEQGPGAFGTEPSDLLTKHLRLLKKGKALDLGCGEGRNAKHLASAGFDVLAIDHSAKALEHAESDSGNISGLTYKQQSLDFFVMDLMTYDLIVVSRVRPELTMLKSLAKGLKPGGWLLFDVYLKAACQSPSKDAWHLTFEECYGPNEVLKVCEGLTVRIYTELDDGTHGPRAQALAQKPHADLPF